MIYACLSSENSDSSAESLQDILRFKKEGRLWYDWGGWYEGHDDQDRLRINQFKESFGSQIMITYHGEELLSVKARIFTVVAKLIRRL